VSYVLVIGIDEGVNGVVFDNLSAVNKLLLIGLQPVHKLG